VQAALALTGGAGPSVGAAALEVVVSTVEFQAFRPVPGLEAAETALALAKEVDSEAIWANGAALVSAHLTMLGRFRESSQLLERAHELNDKLDQGPLAFFVASFGSFLGFLKADWPAALRWTQTELETTRLSQAPAQRDVLLRFNALALAHMGRLAEARPILEEIDEIPSQISLASFAGDWERCERLVRQDLEIYRANGVAQSEVLSLQELASARYHRGDLDGAVESWREHNRVCIEVQGVVSRYFSDTHLAIALARLGRVEEAEPHLASARQLLDNGENWAGARARAELAAGVVAAAHGSVSDAAAHFDQALRLAHEYQDRWEEAETFHLWGRALLDVGERRSAVEKLDAALGIFREMDAGTPWLEPVLADKLRAQGSSTSHEVKHTIDMVAASIDVHRPDFTPHAAPDGTVTLMFSDMEGFTEMTQRLGDLGAHEVIRRHNTLVRQACSAHRGYEVELQGDGFLLAFGSARAGLQCAMTIQSSLAEEARKNPEQPIRVRIGLHTGEALRDADRFFGKTVILAARIAARARGGEILVSSLLKELTESVGDLRFGEPREVELKGFPDPHRVFPVEWR
jgi:class 3 adenylate cyclase